VPAVDLERTLAVVTAELRAHLDLDWAAPAGTLSWSRRDTAVHIAHDLLAYAGQVAARPDGAYLPMDLTVRDSAGPAEIVTVVDAAGTLLIRAVAAAAPGDRGWHWGPADPSGFAALGMNELLNHAYDITGRRPPPDLAAAVLARLFPDAPDGDPADVLLWCTGRIALPGRERRTGWVVTAAVNP
jgi:hypothetical protein